MNDIDASLPFQFPYFSDIERLIVIVYPKDHGEHESGRTKGNDDSGQNKRLWNGIDEIVNSIDPGDDRGESTFFKSDEREKQVNRVFNKCESDRYFDKITFGNDRV
jgi:hypothetical protein